MGDGGLTIVSSGSSPATVVLGGRQVTSGGIINSHNDFPPTVQFAGSGGFSAQSAINGCSVADGCATTQPPPAPPPPTPQTGAESILGPIGLMTNALGGAPDGTEGPSPSSADDGTTSDESSDGDDSSEEGDQARDGDINTDLWLGLNGAGADKFDPLIDDPVTSGGPGADGGGL